jgi:hypothetical protein
MGAWGAREMTRLARQFDGGCVGASHAKLQAPVGALGSGALGS